MTSLTPRLDLDPKVLKQAKRAMAVREGKDPDTTNLEKIPFSTTLELALNEFGPKIQRCLEEAGFKKQEVQQGRPRRVPEALWKRLEKLSEEYDASRITFVRAVLALLAAEAPEEIVKTEAADKGAVDEGEAAEGDTETPDSESEQLSQ